MKSAIICCLAILPALQLTTVSCSDPVLQQFARPRPSDWSPNTPISLVPQSDETDRLKEALELLNMGKQALGLETEPPEALLDMAGNSDDKAKAKGIDKILKRANDHGSMGKQILVMSGEDKGRMSVQNFVNSTLSPDEDMAVKNGGKVQDFFKMEMEKKTPVENGDVYNKITILQANKQGPFNTSLSRKKRFRKRMAPERRRRRRRRKREGEMRESLLKVNGRVFGPQEDRRREFGRAAVVVDPMHHSHGGGIWSKIKSFFDFLKPAEIHVTEKPTWSGFKYGGGIHEGREDKLSGGYLNVKSSFNYTASIEVPFKINDTTPSQNLILNDTIRFDGLKENLRANISNLKSPEQEENSNGKRGGMEQPINVVLTSNIDSSMSTRNPDSATEVKMLKTHSSSSAAEEIFPDDISKRKSRSKDNGPVANVPLVSLDVVRQSEFQGGRFPFARENWHENQLYFSGLIGACMMFLVVVCIVTGVIVFRKIDRKDQDFSPGNLNLKGKHLILKLSGEEDDLNDHYYFQEPKEMVFKRPFYANSWKRGRYVPLHNEEDDFDFAGLDWQSEMGEWLSEGELSK